MRVRYIFPPDEVVPIPPIPDEDFWTNPVRPVAAYPAPRVFSDEFLVLPVPPIREEVYWINPVLPVIASNFLRLPYLPDVEEVPTFFPLEKVFGTGQVSPTFAGSGQIVGIVGDGEASGISGAGEINAKECC